MKLLIYIYIKFSYLLSIFSYYQYVNMFINFELLIFNIKNCYLFNNDLYFFRNLKIKSNTIFNEKILIMIFNIIINYFCS